MNPIHKLIGEAEDFSEYADILALDAEQEKTLFNRELRLTPEQAYYEAIKSGKRKGEVPERIEKTIAKSAYWAYTYAVTVPCERFLLGEPAIAASPSYAQQYASSVVDRGDFIPGSRRFPPGEPAIAKKADHSYYYALYNVSLGDFVPRSKRFPPGEPVLSEHPAFALRYAEVIMGERFIEAEPALKEEPGLWYQYCRLFKIK